MPEVYVRLDVLGVPFLVGVGLIATFDVVNVFIFGIVMYDIVIVELGVVLLDAVEVTMILTDVLSLFAMLCV